MRAIVLALAAFVSLGCIRSALADPWTVVSSGTSANLRGVAMNNDHIIYAVGEKGTILKTIDGGASWIAQKYFGAPTTFCSATADDSVFACATAENGSVSYCLTGKGQWQSTQPIPDTLFAISVGVDKIDTAYWDIYYWQHSLQSSTYWAVGTNGNVVQLKFTHEKKEYYYPDYYPITDTMYVEVNQFSTPTVSAMHAIAVNGANYYGIGDNGAMVISRTKGTSWTTQTVNSGVAFRAIALSSSGRILAVGKGGNIWLSTNDAQSWKNVSLPGLKENLNAIQFVGRDSAVIVGDNGLILQTVDGGVTWVRQAVKTFQHLRGIHGYSRGGSQEWVAVGDSGTIVMTTTGQSIVKYNIDKDTIEFGSVTVGTKQSQTLTFTNSLSDGFFTVRASSSSPLVKLSTTRLVVDPQTTGAIQVTYSPTDTVATELFLVMQHDASWIPDTVWVFGRGVAVTQAISRLSRSSIDYGIGNMVKHESVTVFNAGNISLRISSLQFADTVHFGSGASLPMMIAPGDSAHIIVDLKTPVTTDVSSYMVIGGNAEGGNDTVRLSAQVFRVGVQEAVLRADGFLVSAYPNPVSPGGSVAIHIVSAESAEISLHVTNEAGAEVFNRKFVPTKESTVLLPLARMARGIYAYAVTNSAGMLMASGKISMP